MELWPQVRVLDDSSAGVEAIAAAPQRFVSPAGAYASLGMGRDPVWLRIPYTVSAGGEGQWILDLGYALLSRVDVYVYSGDKLVRRATLGYDQPAAERPLPGRTHAVLLELAAGSSGAILLHIEKTGARILPVSLARLPSFLQRVLDEQLLQGAFACLGVVLVLYSLGQWLALRDSLYLTYALVVSVNIVFVLHLFGVG